VWREKKKIILAWGCSTHWSVQDAMGKVTIESIFQTAQQTAATHKKCVKQLNKLAADEPKEFVDKFLTLIKLPLLVYKREPAVERLISLIINFSTHTDLKFGGESFPLHLVRQLVPLTALNNVKKGEDDAKAVRFRSCQVIAGVLHGLPDDADLPFVF
jgi:condensin complex subunit 3